MSFLKYCSFGFLKANKSFEDSCAHINRPPVQPLKCWNETQFVQMTLRGSWCKFWYFSCHVHCKDMSRARVGPSKLGNVLPTMKLRQSFEKTLLAWNLFNIFPRKSVCICTQRFLKFSWLSVRLWGEGMMWGNKTNTISLVLEPFKQWISPCNEWSNF